jgi:hypothetical protein
MRSEDLELGRAYELAGTREARVIVTVLETSPEDRRRSKVRVRFESGVKRGEISLIWTGKILRPPDRPAPPRKKRPQRRTSPPPDDRPIVRGDVVTLEGTGDLLWTVANLDPDKREATIDGEPFGQRLTITKPLSQLRLRPPRLAPVDDVDDVFAPFEIVSTPPEAEFVPDDLAAIRRAQLAPETPRRALDVLLEDVLFSEACVREYGRTYAPKAPASKRLDYLRGEVLRRGFLVPDGSLRDGEYARIQVPGRFEFTLPTRPAAEHPVQVSELRPAPRRRRSQRRNKGARRDAA